jgi:hypothetical protein
MEFNFFANICFHAHNLSSKSIRALKTIYTAIHYTSSLTSYRPRLVKLTFILLLTVLYFHVTEVPHEKARHYLSNTMDRFHLGFYDEARRLVPTEMRI